MWQLSSRSRGRALATAGCRNGRSLEAVLTGSSVRLTGKRKEYASCSADDRSGARIDVDQYKYGFETDDRDRSRPPRVSTRSTVRFISKQEGRARLDAGMAAGGLRRWKTMTRADLGQRALSQDRLPEPAITMPRRSRPRGQRAWRRSIPSCCAPTRGSAFRSGSARFWPA